MAHNLSPVLAENAPKPRQPEHTPNETLAGLTALRFLAALMVITFHFFNQYLPQPGERHEISAIIIGHGYIGITFFFILSGFILSYTYAKTDLRRPEAVILFFKARFARIVPLYLLSLIIAAPFFINAVCHSQPGLYLTLYSFATVLAPLGLQSWIPGAAASINFPSWSVSNEEFFYLLFPVLLPLILLRPVQGLLLACLATVAVWSATLSIWQSYGGGYGLMSSSKSAPDSVRLAAQFVKFFPLWHIHEFVFGILLYVCWEQRARHWMGLPMLLGGFGLLFVMLTYADLIPAPIFHNGLMIFPFALLILGGANLRGMGNSGAGSLLVFLGKASYGMYLLHAPLYQILCQVDQTMFQSSLRAVPYLTETLVLVAVLAVASWLHLVFEEPLRRWIMHWPEKASVLRSYPFIPGING